ncbi:nucleotidyl transferase AbiEii/AbiGii toxin family protein [Pseudomonas aeruginosa]|uniref:nucleotidyl transferase AbiEii/AbiGii toxin family protein n=1 Tax=Pseudomonas aeruginosa TaxID=287 RepID=UPI00093B0DAB|nr:nucleotidyl transferase AbiEii/AbiGii toxin family protein [Pseudomonas aeruginosa]MBX6882351.1 nucleotidyl transferase AbiEii/AbiGii toxin family protein [Pseudomonas aeruginosa]MBX6932699.1 nucleotidyl transferase AbiEii/AbiGii toxin family protein [Pseudomonas aeruginosa]MCZ9867156.1 nucleotidyl transferase AbiEii/AbiGii toxin family protein [Pseudomonas aeruginosa]MCZ9906442.1 nucleotidyl transferase AbiEii/AbiGii toxin family protein [Pseudomonas aeruginosa]WHV60940.1 nucleotidyl trans
MSPYTLKDHVTKAMSLTDNQLAQPVVLKEILHYEILNALSNSDLGDRLVFQGGTALRACYDGTRLSEDLDFVCGSGSPEPLDVGHLASVLQKAMQTRYGIEFDAVAGPNTDLGDGVGVKRWTFKIKVPWESQMQRINFEVCNVPSLDAVPVVLRSPYEHQQGLQGIVVLAESQEEIYSDKLVALGLRSHLKARDVWDVHFLAQKGIQPNYDWVAQKVASYGRSDDEFLAGLDAAIERMQAPDAAEKFCSEMVRFVDSRMATMFTNKPAFAGAWLRHAVADLVKLKEAYPDFARGRDELLSPAGAGYDGP